MARHRPVVAKQQRGERKQKWAQRVDSLNKQAKINKLAKSKQPLLHLKTTLQDTLPAISKPSEAKKVTPTTTQHVTSQRGRRHALAKEQEQFKAVLSHAQFRADPLGILRRHLENTVKQAKQK